MEAILRFFEDYWQFLALVAGVVVVFIVISVIVGHRGVPAVRKAVAEPVPPAQPEPEPAPLEAEPGEDAAVVAAEPESAPVTTTGEPSEPMPAVPAADPVVPEAAVVEPPTAASAMAAPVERKEAEPVGPVVAPAPTPATEEDDPLPAAPAPETVKAAPKPRAPRPVLGSYHVRFRSEDGKWIVTRDGSDRILRTLETQTEAIHWTTIKALTQDVEMIVHKKDGSIRANPSK